MEYVNSPFVDPSTIFPAASLACRANSGAFLPRQPYHPGKPVVPAAPANVSPSSETSNQPLPRRNPLYVKSNLRPVTFPLISETPPSAYRPFTLAPEPVSSI